MELYKCSSCGAEFEADPQTAGVAATCAKCGTTASDSDILIKPGTIIGGFEVGKLIGQGGMGNVYRAKQTSMRRDVAMKILHRYFTEDKKLISQFLSEIRTTAQLRHRNIVTALDAGEDKGKYFLAMNFIDGDNVEAKLDRGQSFSEKEALEIALKIADALNYVWSKLKIFHKDIKPSNFMLDKNGEAFLLDLGIAQFIGDVGKERKDRVLGSPYYMSPEQTRGEPLDWHSDQYSLGTSLYHMIVGVPPYDHKEIPKILEMHSLKAFPPPETRNPNVKISKPCVALIEKMMAKKAEDRFASWDECTKAIKEVLEGKSDSGKNTDTKKKDEIALASQRKPRRTADAAGQAIAPSGADILLKPKSSPVFYFIMGGVILVGIIFVVFLFNSVKQTKEAQQLFASATMFYEINPTKFDEVLRKLEVATDVAPADLKPTIQSKLNEVKAAKDKYNRENAEYQKIVAEVRRLIDKHDFEKLVNTIKTAPIEEQTWKQDVKEANTDFVKALDMMKAFKPTDPTRKQDFEAFTKQTEEQHALILDEVKKRESTEQVKKKEEDKKKAEVEQKQEAQKKQQADAERKERELAIQKQTDDFKRLYDDSLKFIESYNFAAAAAAIKEKEKATWLDAIKYEDTTPAEFIPAMDKLLKELTKAQWNIITSLKKEEEQEIFLQFTKGNILNVKLGKVKDDGTFFIFLKGEKAGKKFGITDLHPIEKLKRSEIKDKTALAVFNTVVNIDADFYDKAREAAKGAGFLAEPLKKLVETREKK